MDEGEGRERREDFPPCSLFILYVKKLFIWNLFLLSICIMYISHKFEKTCRVV